MADELRGKVIMVTGASGGIGRGVTKRLAEAGACLALVDRSADHLADAIQALGGDTECYKGFPTDIGDETALNRLIEHTIDQFTQIDGLVHIVGGYEAGKPVHESGIEVFDKMMNLNARLVYMVCGRVAKQMIETATQGSISIVLARAGQKGTKHHAAYSASKAAATRIMESMALELRDYGIRVNGISPSTVDTPANRASMPDADFSKWVTPEQVGDLMAFLASDAAAAINGTNIEINARS